MPGDGRQQTDTPHRQEVDPVTTVPIMWTPDSGTHEMPRYRRGVPFAEQPTEEIGFWQSAPSVTRYVRPRWSFLARALAVLVAVDAIGLLYVAVTA